MKNKLKSSKRSSKSAAPSQQKTSQGRATVRPKSESELPCIALFKDGIEGQDGGLSEEQIDLTEGEYAALKKAAAPTGDGILMFMANVALERAGWPDGPVTCIFKLSAGTEVARVDLPRQYFSRIEAAASRQGITLQRFFNNALRNFIKSQAVRRAE